MTVSTSFNFFRFIFFVSFTLVLSGCGGGGSESTPTSLQAPTQRDYKLEELEFIDKELRENHPDAFFNLSESEYSIEFEAFKAAAETMTGEAFRLETAKFVAGIGDQHTYVSMPLSTMKKFPIKVWWDDERAIVIESNSQYNRFLGQELLSIDGYPLSEIKDIAMEYLAYQNPYWKDALSPRFIHLASVLKHEGITSSEDIAAFTFEFVDGTTEQVDISSVTSIDWISIEDTHDPVPLYKRSNDNYSIQVEDDVLFLQYRSAFSMDDYSIASYITDIDDALASGEITKIIVDLRFNWGGRIDHFVPVIQHLAQSELNHSDSLFVLTGRNSFSSAVGAIYSFDSLTNATFVGGPSGGKPNGFSHVIGYRLPGSQSAFYMATQYLAVSDQDTDAFYPDHTSLFTQQDFLAGTDPAMVFIRANF